MASPTAAVRGGATWLKIPPPMSMGTCHSWPAVKLQMMTDGRRGAPLLRSSIQMRRTVPKNSCDDSNSDLKVGEGDLRVGTAAKYLVHRPSRRERLEQALRSAS